MLTVGHLSASYLISKIPVKHHITKRDIWLIVVSGYFLDLDVLIALLIGISPSWHHFLPTHTPLFVLALFALFLPILKKYFSPAVIMLGLLSAIVHLVLDDIGYWLQFLSLQTESKIPQIFWLYPFDHRRALLWSEVNQAQSSVDTLKTYFINAKANVVLEIVLFITVLVVLVVSKLKGQRKLGTG